MSAVQLHSDKEHVEDEGRGAKRHYRGKGCAAQAADVAVGGAAPPARYSPRRLSVCVWMSGITNGGRPSADTATDGSSRLMPKNSS